MRHIILQLHITGRCNLQCKHCYIDDHAEEMPYHVVERVLKQFDRLIFLLRIKAGGNVIPHLHLTGGEPFFHRDIDRILGLLLAVKNKYRLGIMSNGTLLNEHYVEKLKLLNLKAFQVSLDGSENTHNALRGAGNYQAVLRAMDQLYRGSIPCRVSFTAHKDNYRQIPEAVSACRAHHVTSFWSDRYIPFSKSSLLPLDSENMQEYSELLQVAKADPLNISANLNVQNNRALQFLYPGGVPYICTAADCLITVDEHGNILPCRRMPIICGNIQSDTLRRTYFLNKVFIDLRAHRVSEKCLKCPHLKYCKGGARCMSYALLNRYDLPDPCCYMSE